MSWFKLGQRTDKPRSLFTFDFDNLNVRLVLTFEIDFSISFKVYKVCQTLDPQRSSKQTLFKSTETPYSNSINNDQVRVLSYS